MKDKTDGSLIVEMLQMPKDLALHCPVVTALGRSEVRVENFQGIQLYTTERIVIKCSRQKLVLEGKELLIAYYTKDEMKINGRFHSILFE